MVEIASSNSISSCAVQKTLVFPIRKVAARKKFGAELLIEPIALDAKDGANKLREKLNVIFSAKDESNLPRALEMLIEQGYVSHALKLIPGKDDEMCEYALRLMGFASRSLGGTSITGNVVQDILFSLPRIEDNVTKHRLLECIIDSSMTSVFISSEKSEIMGKFLFSSGALQLTSARMIKIASHHGANISRLAPDIAEALKSEEISAYVKNQLILATEYAFNNEKNSGALKILIPEIASIVNRGDKELMRNANFVIREGAVHGYHESYLAFPGILNSVVEHYDETADNRIAAQEIRANFMQVLAMFAGKDSSKVPKEIGEIYLKTVGEENFFNKLVESTAIVQEFILKAEHVLKERFAH